MQALQVSHAGATPAFADIRAPVPGPGEVLVEVAACGLNFADLLMAQGKYQDRPPMPVTLGMEIAGRIAAVGSGVTRYATGDRVAGFPGQDGLAPICRCAADACLALPDTMPFDAAAAFQVTYGTSHLALTDRAHLARGETLVVLGAAGGVGLTAVEIGAKLGARVIAVARGEARRAIATAAGASETLDSDGETDLRAALKDLGGADVVYDAVGDPAASDALRACKPGARYLAIGFAAGQVPAFALNYLLVKNITVHGFNWGGYRRFAPEKLTQSLASLMGWYETGDLSPHIGHRLPFAQAADGLALLRDRQATGKVVITF